MTGSGSPPAIPDPLELAGALRVSIGLFLRQLRQVPGSAPVDPEALSVSAMSVLARLYNEGSKSSSELARAEQISPQSMGATVSVLEARGLVDRQPDPSDGRRVEISLTAEGLHALRRRRDAKAVAMAQALEANFTPAELRQIHATVPLIERLAQRM